MTVLKQTPAPGEHKLCFRGDTITFTLELSEPLDGKAFLRTNIGNAEFTRKEIISSVENGRERSGQDWSDIQLSKVDETTYSVTLALNEVAHFEGKCCFFPVNSKEPIWPDGSNTHINIAPTDYCSSNSIYCAFIRQFGENKNKLYAKGKALANVKEDVIEELDKSGYAVIPPSGTFRDFIKEVDFIVDELKCRIIHLLPINPTPTVYGRMGRYGSPYASLDFTGIDPTLCEFDRKATPLDQFLELVGAIHNKNAKLFIDIAINHTGWAAKIHEIHPEWLVKEDDGTIHSPGAWGVTWGDLTELNHEIFELWQYLADMFLVWCERGVDGFRCDAGYMIPFPAWEYIIARVREKYPDVIFLLEGLGGDPLITLKLLNEGNMNWAYSELFQNYSKMAVEGYINYSDGVSASDGLMVHYAETHDNLRLAATSHSYAKMRTALSAFTSSNGAFGFANGVEWFAKEKIDVHMAQGLNWGAKENQVEFISRLNCILAALPAFQTEGRIKFIDSGSSDVVAFIRGMADDVKPVLVIINLNSDQSSDLRLNINDLPKSLGKLYDLITKKEIKFTNSSLKLKPGEALCLSWDKKDITLVDKVYSEEISPRTRINEQKARAMVLDVLCWKNSSNVVNNFDCRAAGLKLLNSPDKFLEDLFSSDEAIPVVRWKYPEDLNRTVLVPPNHLFIIESPYRFHAMITDEDDVVTPIECLKQGPGKYFSVVTPKSASKKHQYKYLNVRLSSQDGFKKETGKLLFLAEDFSNVKTLFDYEELRDSKHTFLATNGRGGILYPALEWKELRSRYNCLLGANLSTEFPEDRHIMLRRFRAWVVYHGRWQEISLNVTEEVFKNADGGVTWNFKVPLSNGIFTRIAISMNMVEGKNAIRVNVQRLDSEGEHKALKNETPVKVLIRPDVEDRNFHMDTKASQGPENHWPYALETSVKSMTFKPADDRQLRIITNKGRFNENHEWQYNIFLPNEASRGLEANGDLFSPGLFEIDLLGGQNAKILAEVLTAWENDKLDVNPDVDTKQLMTPAASNVYNVLLTGMKDFVVKRNSLKTVIAGYPWFLDWGRDTLICARGLISAGYTDDVKMILLQFAKFAENGTLPNIIHGDNVGNRDTSDAPLWLFVATSDLCKEIDDINFIESDTGNGKTIKEVLVSLAEGYLSGTPNNISVDSETGLVYSPPHFTWMDTNYPAGTPREGYPIEIQALWFFALNFLFEVTGDKKWQALAEKVQKSILKYYLNDEGYLSDCLHCSKGTVPKSAIKDDHLRPNQLFAVTLGAVKDKEIAKQILNATQSLLIPGAIRSLADKPTEYPLPIYNGDNLLNNPNYPYWGNYSGDEDTRRKPAYHNGTAWSWPFPSYVEAYYSVYGEFGVKTARSILASSEIILNEGCIGQIPEILDGNAPHKERGCDAQAWGITELYRVWKLIH